MTLRAEAAPAGERDRDCDERPAGPDRLRWAIGRMRFMLGLDLDLTEFHARFRGDPLIGPALRRRPWARPLRSATPWEALAWAITGQLIEAGRACEIQRHMIRRWGPRRGAFRDAPGPEAVAALSPAELVAADLSERRAIAMRRCAAEVAAGRIDLDEAEPARARLLSIPEIGPWTIQCLGLFGRGDPDALPAGDLAYVKLVGRLAGLGRRATVPEIEEFFAPYEPLRGLAGMFALIGNGHLVAQGPPLRMAA